jgi:predicted O-methyltransferase YrrM
MRALGERIRNALRKRRPRAWLNRVVASVARRLRLGSYLVLDYPPAAANTPRYGYGRPPHAELDRLISSHEDAYRASLETISGFEEELAAIESRPDSAQEPAWINDFLPGLDAAALYGFVRARRPSLYMEIGSGNSTKFVARAIRDGQLDTKLVSIDPFPRAEIDELCTKAIRSPLEQADLAVFDKLGQGDILFFDGSHRTFMNSDVTTFFLEVLPQLRPGVLVGIHDIYLPYDYPPEIADRYYSEQYLLAAHLLGGGAHLVPVLANAHVSRTSHLNEVLATLWARPQLEGVTATGEAFWSEIR